MTPKSVKNTNMNSRSTPTFTRSITDAMSVLTTLFKPSTLDNVLKGRNTLILLIIDRLGTPGTIPTKLISTNMKSIIFQPLRR